MVCAKLTLAGVAAIALAPGIAAAATIDVLWTSGDTGYNANITELAGEASGFDPASNGNLDWSLSLWDASTGTGPAGGFDAYDVLVIGSTCNFLGSQNCGGGGGGYYGNNVFIDGIIALENEITAARGTRTFLSGQDADWHDLNNRPNQDDGPKGFMINAVNWAASGTGLGIVSMTDRISNNNGWWTADGSFLQDELGSAPFSYNTNAVNIGPGQDTFPVNEGLTSAGLSSWSTSSHACFGDVDGYTAINVTTFRGAECGVTIVTSAFAGGGTSGGNEDPVTPVIPLPAAAWLLLGGLGGLAAIGRRRS